MSLTTITIRILEMPETLTEEEIEAVSEDFLAGWDACYDQALEDGREKVLVAFDEAVKTLFPSCGSGVSTYCSVCIARADALKLRELLFGEPNA